MYKMLLDRIEADRNRVITSFLMAGQSNMAGRGDFGEVPPIDNPKCLMLRNGRWQPMTEPINPDRAVFDFIYHSGVGLAGSFADMYANGHPEMAGLIPCADGGTVIEQWMPGEVLFDSAVFNAKLAMRTSRLGGILWHHGESNCAADIDDYIRRTTLILTTFRRELGSDNLPIIMGEISENISPDWGCEGREHEMNLAIRRIADSLPNCAVASSEGLTLKKDGIHFDSRSAREFGRRYYAQYTALTQG